MFAHGEYEVADSGEASRAGQGAPGNGVPLLRLDHPQIALSLIVVPRDGDEAAHVPLVLLKAGPHAFGQGIGDRALGVEEHVKHGLRARRIVTGAPDSGDEFARDVHTAQGLAVVVDALTGGQIDGLGAMAHAGHIGGPSAAPAARGQTVSDHHIRIGDLVQPASRTAFAQTAVSPDRLAPGAQSQRLRSGASCTTRQSTAVSRRRASQRPSRRSNSVLRCGCAQTKTFNSATSVANSCARAGASRTSRGPSSSESGCAQCVSREGTRAVSAICLGESASFTSQREEH